MALNERDDCTPLPHPAAAAALSLPAIQPQEAVLVGQPVPTVSTVSTVLFAYTPETFTGAHVFKLMVPPSTAPAPRSSPMRCRDVVGAVTRGPPPGAGQEPARAPPHTPLAVESAYAPLYPLSQALKGRACAQKGLGLGVPVRESDADALGVEVALTLALGVDVPVIGGVAVPLGVAVREGEAPIEREDVGVTGGEALIDGVSDALGVGAT